MKKTIVLLIAALMLITTLVSCKPEPKEPEYVDRACIYREAYYNGTDGNNDYYTGDDSSDAFYKIADKNLPSYTILSKGDYDFAEATCSCTKDGKVYFGGTVRTKGEDKRIVCYWKDDGVLHLCNKDDSKGNISAVAIAVDDDGKVFVAANLQNDPYDKQDDKQGYYDGSTWIDLVGYNGTTSYFPNGYQKDFMIPQGGMGFSPDGKLVIVATRNGKIDETDDDSWRARPAYWVDGTFHALYTGEGLATAECYVEGFGFDQDGNIKVYANSPDNCTGIDPNFGYFLDSGTIPNWNKITDTGEIYELSVNGSDVFATGKSSDSKEGYWKNASFSELADAREARHIYANGSDVYVIGEKQSKPGFWKNGEFTAFPTIANYNTMEFKVSTMNYYGIGYQTVEAIEEIN
ncbi:MAG: hypothetical protein M0Q94_09045 [Candidatus Cloacimonetes bacterium]|nr:hypothetical protein [Candidatus Cloacimonadota bacterium]